MFTKLHQLLLFDKKYRLNNKIQWLLSLLYTSQMASNFVKSTCVETNATLVLSLCCTVLANKRRILPNLLWVFSLFRLLYVTSSLQQSEGWHGPKTETKYFANKLVEAICYRELCSWFAFPRFAPDVRKAHPCDVVHFLVKYKKSCHKML